MRVFPREFFHYRLVVFRGAERFHLYPAHITATRILAIVPEKREGLVAIGQECFFRLESRNHQEPLQFSGQVTRIGNARYRGYPVRVAYVVPSLAIPLTDDLIAVQMAVDEQP